MQIWAGLGNPEPRYALNRHNIGFMVIDAIAEVEGLPKPAKKHKGWVTEARIGGEKIILLKPATFMNESGQSIRAAMDFYKLTPQDITVFYDELDLAPFKVKVKQGGGAAGHNGIRSAIAHLSSPEFWRVRIGIGHPGDKKRVSGYVLSDFAKADQVWLERMVPAIADHSGLLIEGNECDFMTRVIEETK